MSEVNRYDIQAWCRVPVAQLPAPEKARIPYRLVESSEEMGRVMAGELAEEIRAAKRSNRPCRVIIPCGPKSWIGPFHQIVENERLSLRHVVVFHMDDCLDANCRPLHPSNPFNFRAEMERDFYGGISVELNVPVEQRFFPSPANMDTIRSEIAEAPIDITLGGWGPDGHIAYNQASREPFGYRTVEELRNSQIRIVTNNPETVLSLAHRNIGAAYYLVPPLAITLGLKECLSARKVRLFSDTGTWKQTAFRVALFSNPVVDYPITLLQEHPDALITATRETADHPLAHHPEWELV